MSDLEQIPSHFTDMQSAWDTFRQLSTPDGVRLEEAWATWAEEQRQRLALPGAQTDFDELCQDGCVQEILASILALIRFAPKISELWQATLGRTDKREKLMLSMEEAATALEDYYAGLATTGNSKTTTGHTTIKREWPLNLIFEIRSHNDMVTFFGRLLAKLEVNSLPEFARYLLVDYVMLATGRPHDGNVCGILGEIVGPADYNDVALRMWRARNYKRLAQHLSMFPQLLLDLSLVVSRRT
jgi:hypothetical protein